VAEGICVAVGKTVAVGGTTVGINVAETIGVGTKVGGAEVVQAVSKPNHKIQIKNRFTS
jgi:hypothetical protein